MFEKVNPAHPDKCADRIAGAIVDLCYRLQENPKVAIEALIGHGYCKIMIESSIPSETMTEHMPDIYKIVDRIGGGRFATEVLTTSQDWHLANNQAEGFKCGDNGIFKGMPVTSEQQTLTDSKRLTQQQRRQRKRTEAQ